MDLRQKILSEHVKFFNEKFLEVEDVVTTRAESLEDVQENVRKVKEDLENELGTAEFMRNMFLGKGDEILLQLSSLLSDDTPKVAIAAM